MVARIMVLRGGKDIIRVRDRLMRIRDNIPLFSRRATWMIAQKNMKHIRMMAGRFKRPRGVLQGSIKARKLVSGEHGVFGTYYAWYVDRGRGPGRRPPAGPHGKLARWAGSPVGGRKLSRYIGKYGTSPTRFIRDGISSARPDWQRSLKEHFNYFLKSGGRGR